MMNTAHEPIVANKFSHGDVIACANAESHGYMTVVLRGNVSVYKKYKTPEQSLVKKLEAGGYYSELSLFLDHAQTETLVAMSEVTVAFITPNNLKDFFSKHPEIAISVVESICKRLEAFVPPPVVEEPVTPVPAATSAPEPLAASQNSNLFPEGHGSYTLPLTNSNQQLVYCAESTCPICDLTFENLGVLMSRARKKPGKTEFFRERYVDVEPLYYEIITCPDCLYSADYQSFSAVSKKLAPALQEQVEVFKESAAIKAGRERDTFTVFAGYYLAMICAAVTTDNYQVRTAALWLKISRLYSDCGDKKMERFALEKALYDFNYAYTQLFLTEEKSAQVCYMLGELHYALENFEESRNFYFMTKKNPFASLALKNKAESRMDEVREVMLSRAK